LTASAEISTARLSGANAHKPLATRTRTPRKSNLLMDLTSSAVTFFLKIIGSKNVTTRGP
jgi:hypothetical protein